MRITLSAYAVEDGAVLIGLASGHCLFLVKNRQWFPVLSQKSDAAELTNCLIGGSENQYLTVSGLSGGFDLLTGDRR